MMDPNFNYPKIFEHNYPSPYQPNHYPQAVDGGNYPNGYSSYQRLTLRDYLTVLFRHKGLIVLVFLGVLTVVGLGLFLQTLEYEAKVKMLITAEKNPQAPYLRELLQYRQAEITLTQSEIVNSNAVLDRTVDALKLYERPVHEGNPPAKFIKGLFSGWVDFVKEKTGLGTNKIFGPYVEETYLSRRTVENLKKRVEVEPIRNTDTFVIRVKDTDPMWAARIANSISRSYVIFDLEQQLAALESKYGPRYALMVQVRNDIDHLSSTLDGRRISNLEAIGPASVKIVEQAMPPLEPVGIPRWLIFSVALGACFVLGPLVAFLFEYMDPTLKSTEEIKHMNLPLLGFIPKRYTFNRNYWMQLFYESTYFAMREKNVKSMLMVPLESRKDCATITAGLGRYITQQADQKVLLIDGNLRNPTLDQIFQMTSRNDGFAQVLERKVPLDKAVEAVDSNLHVLFAGKTNMHPLRVLSAERIREVVKAATEQYDAVFIISENPKFYKDALIFASCVDNTVLIVNEGKTRSETARSCASEFNHDGRNLGIVLNNRRFVIPNFVYERL